MQKLFKKDFFWIVLIILVSLMAIFPLFRPGFYPFHDEPQIANLYQMVRAISSGQIPPRWAPDMSFNYGYPLFNFYYPLPFYLGSFFFFLLNKSLVWSLKLVFLLSVPLSGICFYLFARKFFRKETSFAGAIIYIFTPYRAVDLYVRGAVGEMWSFVFMPLVLFFFINLIEKRSLKNIFFSGLSLAGLILAHNLTSIIFFPFFLTFCLAIIFQNKEKIYRLVSIIFGLLLGLSLSAYYWLPAIIERKYIQPGTPYNPLDHFPFIKQLLSPKWGYGASVWGPNDQMSFQIGIANLLVVILITILFFLDRKKIQKEKKFLLILILFFFVICVFLMNVRSWFFWQILPLGNYVQFPWRFLLLTTFFSSFLVGFFGDLSEKSFSKYLPFLLAVLAIIVTLKYFRPEKFIKVDDDYYLSRFFANRTSKGKREFFSDNYLKYSEDYLPLTIWTKKRPDSLPDQKIEIKKGSLNFKEISPTFFEAEIEAEEPTEVIFHNYFFPGWEATVDNHKEEIKIKEPYGEISIPLSSGKHLLVIRFLETPIRLFADLITFVSLVILIFLSFGKLNPKFSLKLK